LNIQKCRDELDLSDLNEDQKTLFHGTVQNRDLLNAALAELEKDEIDHKKIGQYLTRHHSVLRDVLQVSTSKIESMMDAAQNAGALGGKINGSGGGGCMFTYAPENPESVAEAIESVGGKSYIIHSDEGTKVLI
jgi:galactokinase